MLISFVSRPPLLLFFLLIPQISESEAKVRDLDQAKQQALSSLQQAEQRGQELSKQLQQALEVIGIEQGRAAEAAEACEQGFFTSAHDHPHSLSLPLFPSALRDFLDAYLTASSERFLHLPPSRSQVLLPGARLRPWRAS